ncbi:MAG: aminotransferase class I/II-fold pyridoxal phosphate-dependent enzyme [Chitinophagales bacterium]|nr:aminotransferase class I/II-fold pyridoxal phosphate-dependent enzyme [Chitinophagales bacterium]
MKYVRMPIEIESPEQMGYDAIRCNLTESSVRDLSFEDLNIDLNELVICYGHHVGKPELRALIAKDNQGIETEDVLLTTGAAGALFIIHTSLLSADDHLIVMRPNYGTNIETPKALGCATTYIDLDIANGFKANIDAFRAAIQPNTKLISITTPHNPTGVSLTLAELQELIALGAANKIPVLVDETYREIPIGKTPLPMAASLSEWAISICSLSKSYGLPGIRLGWLATKNKVLLETFLAAKEQIYICNSVVDEEIAYQAMLHKEAILAKIRHDIQINFNHVIQWLAQEKRLDCVLPDGGVVVFPRIKVPIDINKFYRVLNEDLGTYVGPGHWFEMDKTYFRLGFGWPTETELLEGLANISKALDRTVIV